MDYAIQELNELGLGEDISYEEFEGYLQLLPCKSPEVDTSIEPDYEQLNELQVRKILYRIKYCKVRLILLAICHYMPTVALLSIRVTSLKYCLVFLYMSLYLINCSVHR